ncbi:MAG: transglutaminase-like domain-containing protein [Anaerolineae bacterium]
MNDPITWSFHDEIHQTSIDLPRTALKLAREVAYPDLDVAGYLRRLDELAELARTAVSPDDSVLTQTEKLAVFLFEEQQFQGNLPFYFDPRNSFLNDVLDRRLGIPITLSILFITVGRQLGLPMHGVGMPGHFITALRYGEQDYYFDPYHEGKRLTVQDCANLVRQTTGFEFRTEWLDPTGSRDILIRMLNNLRNVYVQYQQWTPAAAVIELLNQAEPDEFRHLRDLGFVHFQGGKVRLAAQYLDAYLKVYPNAPDADNIRHNIRQAIDVWVRQN